MLTMKLESAAASERISALPARLRAALLAKVGALARKLRDHIVEDKLSGQVLQVRSGVLRASIDYELLDDGSSLGAQVGSYGDVPYAAIQEFGGQTAAHDIVPVKAQALAFLAEGKTVFARVVHHPGSNIPARSYLRSALDDMRDDIERVLMQAVVGELRRK